MDLLDYLRLLRRRWKLIVACTLIAGIAAFLTTPASPTNDNVSYQASHQLIRDNSAASPSALATVSLFVKTGEVPARAAERLDFEGEPAVLAAAVTVETDEQVGTLTLTASGPTREQAAERANVFAEETLALLGERASEDQDERVEQVNEELATLQAEIDTLESQIEAAEANGESTGVLEAERDSKLRQYGAALDRQQQILSQPAPSAGYVSLQAALPELARVEDGGFAAPSSRPARTAIGLALGLAIGLIGVLVLARLDTRLHEVDQAVAEFGLPLVTEVPKLRSVEPYSIISVTEPLSAQAEAYRSLRTALLLNPLTRLGNVGGRPRAANRSAANRGDTAGGDGEREAQVILVTSPAPGDGKTTTSANLAAAMAETGRLVLLMSCDFRRPELHRYFDRPPSPGITDALGEDGPDLGYIAVGTPVKDVYLAPHGKTIQSFGSIAESGRDLIEQARSMVDTIIIDTSPMLATNDASELIPAADAVVIAFRVGQTTVKNAQRTRFLLERLGASTIGIVAIGTDERETSSYAAYYSSAGDGAPESSSANGAPGSGAADVGDEGKLGARSRRTET